MPRAFATLLLLLTTLLWGFAFVAQKSATHVMGPLTFAGLRYSLGTVLMLPFAVRETRRRARPLTRSEIVRLTVLSLSFFLGVYLQQAGLMTTTVTNGGFLTSLYVLFVPLIALGWAKRLPHPVVWIAMPLALVGVFLLNGGHLDRFNSGDVMVIGGAVCWAVQVLLLGELAASTGLPIAITVACFAVTAVLSVAGSLALEAPSLAQVGDAWIELLYSGVLSTAVAFTLQAIAQQFVPPANAAIVLSAESLFAALGGALILGERLPAIGYLGAALIFAAIVMVETVPVLVRRRTRQSETEPAG
jgi:drug/metabolite transporter (DMT)-like permease